MSSSNRLNGKAQALLDAAGRLFAVRGIDGVTTRDISMEAGGVDISLIKYYFGSKEGLIQAVAEFAVAPLQKASLEDYHRENRGLLATRDGQRAFVAGMVEVMFNRFNGAMPEKWCRGFLLQILQKHGKDPMRRTLVERYMKPMVTVFAKVYREVTGNDDFETAFCWYLFITAQLFICSGDTDLIELLHPDETMKSGFSRRMQYFCTQQVLNGFGL
ncbi:MAG: TetR family transcriptional regulator [Victivallales bacterium]